MGCTRLTIVTPSTPTKLHCEHHDTHFDRFLPSLTLFLFDATSDPLNGGHRNETGHVGGVRGPFPGEVSSLQSLPFS
jgi:hypothetical protein